MVRILLIIIYIQQGLKLLLYVFADYIYVLLNKAQREFHEMFTRTYGKVSMQIVDLVINCPHQHFPCSKCYTLTIVLSIFPRCDVPEERRRVPGILPGPEDLLRKGKS